MVPKGTLRSVSPHRDLSLQRRSLQKRAWTRVLRHDAGVLYKRFATRRKAFCDTMQGVLRRLHRPQCDSAGAGQEDARLLRDRHVTAT